MSLVVLAMSGGVDSSVAASLLLEAGHEVVGVFMRHEAAELSDCDRAMPEVDGNKSGTSAVKANPLHILSHKQGCCTASDAADARRVADRLDIPFYSLDLSADFERIMDYFVDEYERGRTPNPCVMCNHWIKFDRLFNYADSIGADCVATGHYARCEAALDSEPALWRGVDEDKDQAYVLFGIRRERLARILLPVGRFHKPEIRARARALGLRVADKKDSQEICFVSPGRHADFVTARKSRDTAGEIVTSDGRVVGRHSGIERFTVGQRKGLGVALGEPFFVLQVDAESNRVTLGRHDELARRTLTASRANWLVDMPTGQIRCKAQIRYNSAPRSALLDCGSAKTFRLTFEEPCHGVAPGQAAVCFDGDRVLGGGWIES
jgi:tRNA-specific 2-thiouridylase